MPEDFLDGNAPKTGENFRKWIKETFSKEIINLDEYYKENIIELEEDNDEEDD
jgi:hypothetical protein